MKANKAISYKIRYFYIVILTACQPVRFYKIKLFYGEDPPRPTAFRVGLQRTEVLALGIWFVTVVKDFVFLLCVVVCTIFV